MCVCVCMYIIWRVHLQKLINATLKKKRLFFTRFVKKAGNVHFQGIAFSHFTAEADKHPCLWTEADKSILANQHAVFRSGEKTC